MPRLKIESPLAELFSCQFLTYSPFLHNITNFYPQNTCSQNLNLYFLQFVKPMTIDSRTRPTVRCDDEVKKCSLINESEENLHSVSDWELERPMREFHMQHEPHCLQQRWQSVRLFQWTDTTLKRQQICQAIGMQHRHNLGVKGICPLLIFFLPKNSIVSQECVHFGWEWGGNGVCTLWNGSNQSLPCF